MKNNSILSFTSISILCAVVLTVSFAVTSVSTAQELCIKNKTKATRNGTIRLNRAIIQRDVCPRGYTKLSLPQGPQGEQGPKGDTGSNGDTGPVGPAGPIGESSVINISTVRFPSNCSIDDYSGTSATFLCESVSTFDKLEDDTVLEVLFYGRFKRPDNMIGNAAIYHIGVDGTFSSGSSGFSGSPGRYVVRSSDVENPQGAIHGVFPAVFAGAGLTVSTYISGSTAGSSGDNPQIDPGNFGNAYAVIREVRVP